MGSIVTAILSIVSSVVGGITEKQKLEIAERMQADQNIVDLMKSQADTNTAEASNPNLFVSGARPFIMWVCGASFAWQYLISPILSCICVLAHHPEMGAQIQSLHLDYSTMNNVLMGMLGLGTLRTYEKYKNVQNNH